MSASEAQVLSSVPCDESLLLESQTQFPGFHANQRILHRNTHREIQRKNSAHWKNCQGSPVIQALGGKMTAKSGEGWERTGGAERLTAGNLRTFISREVSQSNEKTSKSVPNTYLVLYQQGEKIQNNPQHPNKRNLSVNKLTVSTLMSLTVPVIFRLQPSLPLQLSEGLHRRPACWREPRIASSAEQV